MFPLSPIHNFPKYLDIVGALRRFAEAVNILLDAGLIVNATVAELTQENLEIIKAAVDSNRIETVWIGENVTTALIVDLKAGVSGEDQAVFEIKERLQERGPFQASLKVVVSMLFESELVLDGRQPSH